MVETGATIVQIYCPNRELVEHLDRLAERNGLSRSSQSRMILTAALREIAASERTSEVDA